jgi:hypothetical protein
MNFSKKIFLRTTREARRPFGTFFARVAVGVALFAAFTQVFGTWYTCGRFLTVLFLTSGEITVAAARAWISRRSTRRRQPPRTPAASPRWLPRTSRSFPARGTARRVV